MKGDDRLKEKKLVSIYIPTTQSWCYEKEMTKEEEKELRDLFRSKDFQRIMERLGKDIESPDNFDLGEIEINSDWDDNNEEQN